jgi:hypothetical protein
VKAINSETDSLVGITHVVGIDLGDGESTLAWGALDQFPAISVYRRQATGERNILTAIARDPSRRLLIGEEAVAMLGATEFTLNFKEPPDPDEIVTPDSILFVQALLIEFLRATPEVVRDRTLLIIGHPAGWDPETVQLYADHLAVLQMPTRVLPESQAALIHVRGPLLNERARSDAPAEDVQDSRRMLVIDIGSSTTDFTFIEDLAPLNLALGADFGCRAIDFQMAALATKNFAGRPSLMEVLESDGGREFLLLTCRRVKEAQFSGGTPTILNQRYNPKFKPIVDAAWNWLKAVQVPEVIAEPGGWLEQLRELMSDAAGQLEVSLPGQVVLTGGGSRMRPVGQICREVLPTAAIQHDAEPSLSVARGLALAGFHRVRVARFRSEIAGLLRSATFIGLCTKEVDDMLSIMKGQFLAKLKARENVDTDDFLPSLRKLNNRLDSYLSETVPPVCRSYNVADDSLNLDVRLSVPIAEKILAYFAEYAATITRDERDAKILRGIISVRKNIKHLSDNVPAAAVVDLGLLAVAGGLELTSYQKRKEIRDRISSMELAPAETSDLIRQVRDDIQAQLDRRINEIERLIQ